MKKKTSRYSFASLPLINLFLRNIILIILISVLCALIGLGYSVVRVKPVYTASRSVILRTTLSSNKVLANQAALGKIYLSSIPDLIKSPNIIGVADYKYEEMRENENDKIVSGAVGMEYEKDSLIFQLTYRDKSPKLAEEKLEILIDTVAEEISQYIKAEDVQLIATQRKCDIVETQFYTRYTGIGLAVGLGISVIIILMIYMLDNTIKSKSEFEEMTGITVLAHVDKETQKGHK